MRECQISRTPTCPLVPKERSASAREGGAGCPALALTSPTWIHTTQEGKAALNCGPEGLPALVRFGTAPSLPAHKGPSGCTAGTDDYRTPPRATEPVPHIMPLTPSRLLSQGHLRRRNKFPLVTESWCESLRMFLSLTPRLAIRALGREKPFQQLEGRVVFFWRGWGSARLPPRSRPHVLVGHGKHGTSPQSWCARTPGPGEPWFADAVLRVSGRTLLCQQRT